MARKKSKKNKINIYKKKKQATGTKEKEPLINELSNVDKNIEKSTEYIFDDYTNNNLSLMQIEFIKKYIEIDNASEAFRQTLANIRNVSENSIAEMASRELKKPEVKDYILKVKKLNMFKLLDFDAQPVTIKNLLMDKILSNTLDSKNEISYYKTLIALIKDFNLEETNNIEYVQKNNELNTVFAGLDLESDDVTKLEQLSQIVEQQKRKQILDELADLTSEELETILHEKQKTS